MPPGCLLGASWVPPGCLLGASWVPPGCLLGVSWVLPWSPDVDQHGLAEREKDGWGGILDRIHEKSSRPGDYACKGFVKLI